MHFANRLIRQFTNNLLGSDMIVLPDDFMAIRVAYKKGGGSWEKLLHGDMGHTLFLEKLIRTWGKQSGRIRKTEMI